MMLQRTVKKKVSVSGVGLHSGAPTRLTICPAEAGTGIIFVRTDLVGAPEVRAHFSLVSNTQMATTLGKGSEAISTSEHLMAALYGAGVDNARIELDGGEVPVLDGSALPFYQAIQFVGTQTLESPRVTAQLQRRIELKVADKWVVAEPSDKLEIYSSIEWDHPMIGFQEFKYVEEQTAFSEIAGARTFGFVQEVETLKKMGLARGGSMENAIVLDSARVLNPEGLRFRDEFVRHKVLDALGDFHLAGVWLKAKIRMHRSGHEIHRQLLQALFSSPANLEFSGPKHATQAAVRTASGFGATRKAAAFTAR